MVVFSRERKVARKTTYKRRYTSLSSNEQVYLRDLQKFIRVLLFKFTSLPTEHNTDEESALQKKQTQIIRVPASQFRSSIACP